MLISIIIRTYNEERHLSELLAAIRGQEGVWGDVEIIIYRVGQPHLPGDSAVAIVDSMLITVSITGHSCRIEKV